MTSATITSNHSFKGTRGVGELEDSIVKTARLQPNRWDALLFGLLKHLEGSCGWGDDRQRGLRRVRESCHVRNSGMVLVERIDRL